MNHTVVIAHGERENVVQIECSGDDCALCASTAEERAAIIFVKAEDRQ